MERFENKKVKVVLARQVLPVVGERYPCADFWVSKGQYFGAINGCTEPLEKVEKLSDELYKLEDCSTIYFVKWFES